MTTGTNRSSTSFLKQRWHEDLVVVADLTQRFDHKHYSASFFAGVEHSVCNSIRLDGYAADPVLLGKLHRVDTAMKFIKVTFDRLFEFFVRSYVVLGVAHRDGQVL